jgi:hypothetical protein
MASNKERTTSTRIPLSPALTKVCKAQFARMQRLDIGGYTYERNHSDYPQARADLRIFDETGKLSYFGREFGNRTFLWEASAADR